jgi:peptidoglycan/LPS O-acetylase OafA/YrhL
MSTCSDRPSSSVHMDFAHGLAAIIVMLGHSRDLFFSSINGHNPVPHLAQGVADAYHPQITLGNEAVMIFFVLSGISWAEAYSDRASAGHGRTI